MRRIDILAPDLPESVVDATVSIWHKKPGDKVLRDEVLVEIETGKVILEVSALADGILGTVLENEGAIITSCQILGYLYKDNFIYKDSNMNPKKENFNLSRYQKTQLKDLSNDTLSLTFQHLPVDHVLNSVDAENSTVSNSFTDKDGKKDLRKSPFDSEVKDESLTSQLILHSKTDMRSEKRVPMTHLRRCAAERLLEAKNSAAILTTFNEVNMKSIINLRNNYSNEFKKRHGINLGFMSFYVKAVVEALKRYPEINAFIDGDDVVYHNYFDINIAISTPRGLVTPILRDVNDLSIADIEKKVRELAVKGHDGKLTVDDLNGGNFTITNGGVFGSLISTPIINPPQSAILGVHVIKDRPMAVDSKVEILPMMYLALSYDHRLIDGRESVGFLILIKGLLEDPMRLLINL